MQKLLTDIFEHGNLIKLILGNPRRKSQQVKKITIRPVSLGICMMYQAESHYQNKVLHSNMTASETMDFIKDSVQRDFKQINIFTTENDIQILANKPDKPKIIKKAATIKDTDTSHNRSKQYIIMENQPCDFLIELGVTDERGKVFHRHYNKFRQINRFLEIVDDCRDFFENKEEIKIIDFGCGKSYLTFALYYYFHILNNKKVNIIGLDLKENVIDFCNDTACRLGYEGLSFKLGDIADYSDTGCDMVVTLHACDTATDYALINAVKWKSHVILSVPCCQHELFKQVKNPVLNPMLKHGIIKDKFTELITDGLRSLKLESCGYDVSMIEFTSLEHTSKNIMIKAIFNEKKSSNACQKALEEYEKIKDEFHLSPCIDKL